MQTSLTSTWEKHVNFAQFKEIRSSAKRKKRSGTLYQDRPGNQPLLLPI